MSLYNAYHSNIKGKKSNSIYIFFVCSVEIHFFFCQGLKFTSPPKLCFGGLKTLCVFQFFLRKAKNI